jgi:hypothetical protein
MSLRSFTAAALIALGLAAAPPAPAAEQDLRSPDARDAAQRAASSPTPVNFQSPDARDVTRPRTIVVPVRSVTVADAGFDWGDAAIGAGGALAAMLLLSGGASALGRRRTARRAAA